MNGYFYGLKVIRILLRWDSIANVLTAGSRIWMRQARWKAHLAFFQFDGVIDGGANIGEFAQIVRDTLPKAHLLCVEPNPQAAALLRSQSYEVIEAALWDQDAVLELRQPGSETSGTILSGAGGELIARVKTIGLDRLPIRGNRILVKLDLQGAELQALASLGSLEPRCAGFLCEASLSRNGTYESINSLLRKKGFVPFASVNELFDGNRQIEADILWLRSDLL